MNNKRRKKYLGTALQKRILFLVFLAALIPAAVITLCLYYLIFNMMAKQIGIPEAIYFNLMPVLKQVNFIIIISLPIIFFLLWLLALEFSHRIAGPLYRMERELEDIVSGAKGGLINLRSRDELKSLAEKINKLIQKNQGS